MYACETWTIKKAEHGRTDAFELWCWRRLSRVSWTARRSIKLVNPKGNQSWIFTGRTDADAETPILWPPDAESWLTGKDCDAGKDWRKENKGMTEDEMVGWQHRLDGHEIEQAPGVGDRQRSLACCSPWRHKELDTTERLHWTEPHSVVQYLLSSRLTKSCLSPGELMAKWKHSLVQFSIYQAPHTFQARGLGEERPSWIRSGRSYNGPCELLAHPLETSLPPLAPPHLRSYQYVATFSSLPILYPYYHAPDILCSQALNQGAGLVYYNIFQLIYFPLSGNSTTVPVSV